MDPATIKSPKEQLVSSLGGHHPVFAVAGGHVRKKLELEEFFGTA